MAFMKGSRIMNAGLLRAQCIFATFVLAGCGGSAAVTPGQAFQGASEDTAAVHRTSLADGASFTEFPLPRWQSGGASVALDRTGTPWVLTQYAIDRVGTDGHVTTFQMPGYVRGEHGSLGLDGGITLGRDGALWFLGEVRGPSRRHPFSTNLFRLTTNGKLNSYLIGGPYPSDTRPSIPFDIASGIDGKVWFTIGSVVSSQPGCYYGSASMHGVPGPHAALCYSDGVTTGPDGNMWVALGSPVPGDGAAIISYSPRAKAVRSFKLPLSSNPEGIATGPDDNLWITLDGLNAIMRLTTAGKRTTYLLPFKRALGSWGPLGARIVSGSNAMWFVEAPANNIGRISMSGQITEYPIPTPDSGATGLAISSSCGSYGVHIWSVESTSNKLAMLTAPC
jgi:virginiamycin B lyase